MQVSSNRQFYAGAQYRAQRYLRMHRQKSDLVELLTVRHGSTLTEGTGLFPTQPRHTLFERDGSWILSIDIIAPCRFQSCQQLCIGRDRFSIA
jgi:hypothetical protein